jgi:hypothetical protein
MRQNDLLCAQSPVGAEPVNAVQLDSHEPLRCSAVADENWVPSAAGGLQAIGELGCFSGAGRYGELEGAFW